MLCPLRFRSPFESERRDTLFKRGKARIEFAFRRRECHDPRGILGFDRVDELAHANVLRERISHHSLSAIHARHRAAPIKSRVLFGKLLAHAALQHFARAGGYDLVNRDADGGYESCTA